MTPNGDRSLAYRLLPEDMHGVLTRMAAPLVSNRSL
jgi:hypothetical protein